MTMMRQRLLQHIHIQLLSFAILSSLYTIFRVGFVLRPTTTESNDDKTLPLFSPLINHPMMVPLPRTNEAELIDSWTRGSTISSMMRSRQLSLSACLLIMDDNYRLSEWLAFHYTTAKLTRLIVAIDPGSKTQPTNILDKYRNILKMDITEWTDDNFMPHYAKVIKELDQYNERKNRTKEPVDGLLQRQAAFYLSCMKQLKSENRSWTMLIDTDEFLTLDVPTVPSSALKPRERGKGKDNQVFVDGINRTRTHNNKNQTLMITLTDILTTMNDNHDDVNVTISISDILTTRNPCVYIERRRFGTQLMNETTKEKLYMSSSNNKCLPPMLSKIKKASPTDKTAHIDEIINKFQTIKWTKRAFPQNRTANGPGKTIVDLTRLEEYHFQPAKLYHGYGNPHQPIGQICSKRMPAFQSPFLVHHYPSVTWEQYASRDNDVRSWVKEKSKYDSYHEQMFNEQVDDSVVCWLSHFYDSFEGRNDVADYLLSDAGKI